MRTTPNVIITGTPGVGKTVHCEQLAQDTGLRHLSINQVAKDRDCHESYDDELGSWVIDEDKVRLRPRGQRSWVVNATNTRLYSSWTPSKTNSCREAT